MIDRLEMAQEIDKNRLYAAHLDGRNEGRIEGRIEGERIGEARGEAKTLATVQSLLETGMPIADILRQIGVAEDKIMLAH